MLRFECVSVVAVSGLMPVLQSPSTNLSGPVHWDACSRTPGKQSLESAQVFLGDACSVLRHRSAPKTPPTAVCLNNSPCSYLQRHLHPLESLLVKQNRSHWRAALWLNSGVWASAPNPRNRVCCHCVQRQVCTRPLLVNT